MQFTSYFFSKYICNYSLINCDFESNTLSVITFSAVNDPVSMLSLYKKNQQDPRVIASFSRSAEIVEIATRNLIQMYVSFLIKKKYDYAKFNVLKIINEIVEYTT